jgi:hypothetical protein
MEQTGRDIRVLVDLQAATKFRRLLAKALDLLILLTVAFRTISA